MNEKLFTIDHKGLHYGWVTQIMDSQKIDVNKGLKEDPKNKALVLSEVVKSVTPLVYVLQRGAVFKKKESKLLKQFH